MVRVRARRPQTLSCRIFRQFPTPPGETMRDSGRPPACRRLHPASSDGPAATQRASQRDALCHDPEPRNRMTRRCVSEQHPARRARGRTHAELSARTIGSWCLLPPEQSQAVGVQPPVVIESRLAAPRIRGATALQKDASPPPADRIRCACRANSLGVGTRRASHRTPRVASSPCARLLAIALSLL